jgi:hypothetical protein
MTKFPIALWPLWLRALRTTFPKSRRHRLQLLDSRAADLEELLDVRARPRADKLRTKRASEKR